MSVEREDSGPSFEDTQKLYRTAYETLVGDLLVDPASPLARKVAAEESRFLGRLRKMKEGEETESDAQGQSDVIAFNLGRFSVSVALPVDYKRAYYSQDRNRGRKGAPENRHNTAQTYLFGDGSLKEVGGFYEMTPGWAHRQIKAGVRQMLGAVPQTGLRPETLNFKKPRSDRLRDNESLARGGVTVGIREALKGGATYDELKAMGYTSLQLGGVRKRLAERQQPTVVPRSIRDWGPTLELLADPQTDRVVVCKLIKDVTHSVYQMHPEAFVALSEVARGAGLYPRSQSNDISFIANYLEMQNEPVGDTLFEVKSGKQKGLLQHNFFTLKRYQEEIQLQLLFAEGPRFDKMRQAPIRIIGPMPEKMPSTADFVGRSVKGVTIREYSGVFGSLSSYGMKVPNQLRSLKTNLKDLIGPNPPVSVFLKRDRFFVANVDRQELGAHLARQLAKAKQDSIEH